MARLVAIDPDTSASGIALFDDQELVDARASPIDRATDDSESAHIRINDFLCDRIDDKDRGLVICEMPQQYGREGDQRDFLAVARVVGRFEQHAYERFLRFEAVAPRSWKGNAPKAVVTLRVWEVLTMEERARVVISARAVNVLEAGNGIKSGAATDVLDAIGIGLWKLGRLHGRRKG